MRQSIIEAARKEVFTSSSSLKLGLTSSQPLTPSGMGMPPFTNPIVASFTLRKIHLSLYLLMISLALSLSSIATLPTLQIGLRHGLRQRSSGAARIMICTALSRSLSPSLQALSRFLSRSLHQAINRSLSQALSRSLSQAHRHLPVAPRTLDNPAFSSDVAHPAMRNALAGGWAENALVQMAFVLFQVDVSCQLLYCRVLASRRKTPPGI